MSARNLALEALKSVFDRPDTSASYDAMMTAVQAAIAALEAETGEPVAWRKNHKGVIDVRHTYTDNPGDVGKWAELGVTLEPLYTAPPPAVPQGWKLVPIEPTPEMLLEVDEYVGGHCYDCTRDKASHDDCRRIYASMLAAAPGAPA